MGECVTLQTPGHPNLVDVVSVLYRGGCDPIDCRISKSGKLLAGDIILAAVFLVRAPGVSTGERREIRSHQSYSSSGEEDPGEGNPYTYFTIGAHDDGPLIMRILAEGLGGRYTDERDGSVQDFPLRDLDE